MQTSRKSWLAILLGTEDVLSNPLSHGSKEDNVVKAIARSLLGGDVEGARKALRKGRSRLIGCDEL